MTTDNAAIMRQAVIAVMQEGRVDLVDQFLASDFVGHDTAGMTFGRDDFRQGVLEMLGAFSDRQVEIADQITEGDKVVTRWIATARHTGLLRGVPPTGLDVRITGTSVDRLASGKIIERWEVTDDLGLMRQLGAIPGIEAAAAAAAA